MKMTKRVLACVLSVVLLFGLLPQNVYATEGTDVSGTSDTVTRAEWLKKLEDTFGFSVEEDNYPDNYFSDISSDSKDYYTIMLAAEFGLLDIEAGEAVYPDKPATREFAAHTLNGCLGFQLAEENYTFEDSSETAYPQDDQIAVKRGWFQLADNKFEPETAVTAAEVSGMLKDAEDVLDTAQVDNNYDSTYQFAENVVVIPQGTQVSVDEKDVVTVTDSKVAVNKGDTFVVWPSELPSIYVAEEVIVTDNTMVISTGEADTASAVVSVDSSGTVDMDLSQFEEADGVDVTYVKSQSQADSLIAAYGIEVNNNSILATKDISLANGAKASIACTLSDLSLSQKIDTKNKTYYVSVNGNSTITGSVSMDAVTAALGKTSVTIGSVRVAGVGTVTVSVDLALKGKITATYTGSFETGMQYSEKDGFRLVKSFVKKNFTTTAEATASIGMKVSVGVDMLVLSGTIYATTGITATFNSTTYGDGKKPDNCVQISAWLYVSAGASAKVDLAVWSKSWNKSLDIYNSSNSPVRLSFHYEDGKQVSSCARGNAGKTYVTPIDSKYGISSYGDTSSSGTDSNGESSTIWEYSVSDGTTTITGYNGKASIVCVPAMLDGYKVTWIGSGAFQNNENLKKVVVPEGITTICSFAFEGCSHLESLVLPESLQYLGSFVIESTSIKSITIPKNVSAGSYFDWSGGGPLGGCKTLETVVLEEGMQTVPAWLCRRSSIITVSIPSTVTEIEHGAFYGCDNLKTVNLTGGIESIGYEAFAECNSIENLTFSETLKDIERSAFYGCDNLKTVNLTDGIENIGQWAFEGCNSIKKMIFPETLEWIEPKAFYGCTGLEEISFHKCNGSARLNIGESVFEGCTSLKTVKLAEGLNGIGSKAFAECDSLNNLTLPENMESLGNCIIQNTPIQSITIPKSIWVSRGDDSHDGPLANCKTLRRVVLEEGMKTVPKYLCANGNSITTVIIPSTVTAIDDYAFYGCNGLKTDIPSTVKRIGDYAFCGCDNLKIESLPERIENIGEKAFAGCPYIKRLIFPESLSKIGAYAFYDCTGLEEISFHKYNGYQVGLNIGDGVFEGCTSLKTVKLEKGLYEIGCKAFAECDALESLILPENVISLGYHMIQNTSIQSITIPHNVNSCGKYGEDGPLANCKTLKKVVLEEGMKTVPRYLCENASSITTVVIPSTVTKIYKKTFYNCTSLKDVYFSGTPEEWEKITIEDDNTSLTNATLHYHIHSYDGGKITAPTCTEQGYTTYTCTFCGTSYQTDYIEATGHTFISNIEKDVTCEEDGLIISICSICKSVYKTAIAATGHSYSSDWTADEEQHYHKCEKCDEGKDFAAHTFTWVIDKEATLTEQGVKHEECTTCKYRRNENTVIDKLGEDHEHVFAEEWKTDETKHWKECECGEKSEEQVHTFTWVVDKEATLTEQGVKHEECTTCKYRRNENTVIDKLQQGQGENDDTKKDDSTSNDGTVSDNGAASKDNSQTSDDNALKDGTGQEKNETEAADQAKTGDTFRAGTLKYKITSAENGTVSVTGTKSGIRNSVVIPDKVSYQKKSYKVTMIGAKALKNRKNITRVTIGKNVTAIGKEAFSGDKKIKTIVIKSTGISSVGSKAFKGIYKKATIRVPAKKAAVYKKLLKKKGQASTVKIKG